jgi:uncharacterized protein
VILVDTSVLVYAVGDDHRLQAPCRRLVQLVADGTVSATTTVEAIQEFVHVRSRRRPRPDATALGRAYATLFAPLAQPTARDLEDGLELFEHHRTLGAFDAVLAATARRVGTGILASTDGAFRSVDGLRVLDPADEDFVTSLSDSDG